MCPTYVRHTTGIEQKVKDIVTRSGLPRKKTVTVWESKLAFGFCHSKVPHIGMRIRGCANICDEDHNFVRSVLEEVGLIVE